MAARNPDTKERILATAQALVLEKGFSGTTLDEILKATGVTKGAFFHYFASKAELSQTLIERFVEDDFALYGEWEQRAAAQAENPYQELVLFLKLFEEWLDNLEEPFAGCLLAVYVYESSLMDPGVNAYVSRSFARWQELYERKLAAAIECREPRLPVTAAVLAETLVAMLEGAFILSRTHRDPALISRQLRLFRGYLSLLFEEPAPPLT